MSTMTIELFIEKLKEIFEDADPQSIMPESSFREIDGYSSLEALLIISMIKEYYDIEFTGDDMRKSNTIEELYAIVESRK